MKLSVTSILASVFVAVSFFGGCEPQPEASKTEPEAASKIDPQALAVLKSMSDTLDNAKSFSCKVHQIYDGPSPSGQLVQYVRKSMVSVERPDKLAVTTTGYDFEKLFRHSGTKMTLVDVKGKVYAEYDESPVKIGDMLDFLARKYDLIMPLADIMFPESYKAMIANVTVGEYLGVHKCGKKHECHHLAFEQPDINWQIWIDVGDKPLLRKLLIVYKNRPGMPRYVSVLRDWNLSPEISKDAFMPQIPSDAKRITLDEMLNRGKGK